MALKTALRWLGLSEQLATAEAEKLRLAHHGEFVRAVNFFRPSIPPCRAHLMKIILHRLLTSDGSQRHLCVESRAVVPARLSGHAISCFRHLSRRQADIPRVPLCRLTGSDLKLKITLHRAKQFWGRNFFNNGVKQGLC
jgi:hypothetical protein